jgi:hypothetical protein
MMMMDPKRDQEALRMEALRELDKLTCADTANVIVMCTREGESKTKARETRSRRGRRKSWRELSGNGMDGSISNASPSNTTTFVTIHYHRSVVTPIQSASSEIEIPSLICASWHDKRWQLYSIGEPSHCPETRRLIN